MKKTLITLLALGGLVTAENTDSLLAASDSYLFTSTIDKHTEGSNGGSYKGIQFCLSDAIDSERLTMSPAADVTSFSYILDSFAFQVRAGSSHNGLWAAVLDESNKVIGVSTASASAPSLGMLTFNFSGVQLSSTETYTFVATASAVTLNSTVASNNDALRNIAVALTEAGVAADAASLGVISGLKSLASTNYMPYVEIKVSAAPIPEPATATLSLLALAGLAARRRRK